MRRTPASRLCARPPRPMLARARGWRRSPAPSSPQWLDARWAGFDCRFPMRWTWLKSPLLFCDSLGWVGGSVGASECWLVLVDGGLGDRVRELVAAHEREDRRQGDQGDRAEHPERGVETAGERGGYGVAGMQQRVGMAGRDARRDRDPYRSAELLGGVQKPGGKSRLVLLNAGQGGDRDRNERECGTG